MQGEKEGEIDSSSKLNRIPADAGIDLFTQFDASSGVFRQTPPALCVLFSDTLLHPQAVINSMITASRRKSRQRSEVKPSGSQTAAAASITIPPSIHSFVRLKKK